MPAFIGNLGPGEVVIVVAVILLLFGSQKIPPLMRSMGSGLKEFKKGLAEGARETPDNPRKGEADGDA